MVNNFSKFTLLGGVACVDTGIGNHRYRDMYGSSILGYASLSARKIRKQNFQSTLVYSNRSKYPTGSMFPVKCRIFGGPTKQSS